MSRLIDLTHPMVHGQKGFPTDPPLVLAAHGTVATLRFNISRIEFGSHHGTHVDAMSHFIEGGRTVDRMPLDWFYGPARVLRMPRGPGEEITADDLRPHEAHLTQEAKILLDTGWHRRFGSEAYCSDFPSLALDAGRYLVERGIRLLGLDLPTPSRQWLEFHHIVLAPEAEIVLLEGLANLDALPDEFILAAFPLPLNGLDGSPVRAVAIC